VVIEISDAAPRTPTGSRDPRHRCHIRKRTVSIILIQPADRCICGGPCPFELRPVHQENIQPPVLVVVEKRGATAGCFDQVSLALCFWWRAVSAREARCGRAGSGDVSSNRSDSCGAHVPNAQGLLSDPGKGNIDTTRTDESGNSTQGRLIVGIYEVRIEAEGF